MKPHRALQGRWGGLITLALHLAALGLFIHGFLLTRVHLADRAAAPPPAGTAPPHAPYDRVVWLMIDALRYDMVLADGRYRCPPGSSGGGGNSTVCHQGHMPFLSELARHPAARAFMFVSDAPTTTTQRLKALATGGLPTFFDVSNSFTAGALSEDNLIDQLAGSGRRIAFLGDTTWQQLFPRQWAWSRPYPCFNVKDLHTVDDGVWAHLPGALAGEGAASWDGLLVAHYLGVDHCGHTHGVGSAQMAAKLGQMDSHVRQVVAALAAGAGPGGPFRRTLLLVSGDHGQTLGGDHGGGSPEEVDSVLVALDVQAYAQAQGGGGGKGAAIEALAALSPAGSDGNEGGSGGGDGGGEKPDPAAPAPCRASCSCGQEGNQCAPDLLQLDLTPTLAAMLGVPCPFGNLGKLSAELWQLTAAHLADSASAGTAGASEPQAVQAAWLASLAAALEANVRQVHTYLHTYAATAGAAFSRPALARLDALFGAAVAAGTGVADRVASCYAYLEAAAVLARDQWTQFGNASMVAGLALFAATLALQAMAALEGQSGSSRAAAAGTPGAQGSALSALAERLQAWGLVAPWQPGSRLLVPTLRALLAALVLVHSAGVFSFFYLLSEGLNACYLVAAACAGLAVATGRASRRAGKGLRGVVVLAIMALRCNALMAVLGVAHHTGQGFWARLTVHEPQPEGDVARGWASKLAALKALGAHLAAAAGLGSLPAAAVALLQHGLLCTLPLAVLVAATERLQRGSGRSGLQRLLVLAAFLSAAAYLQLEDAAKHGLLPAGATLQQLAAQRFWPALPAGLADTAAAAAEAAAGALQTVWPEAQRYGALLAALPLRDLLPCTTYVLCGGAAALWLVQAATRRLRGAGAATALAQVLLAALVQVSDRQAPLILLLALLELAAIARLLAKRAELAPAGSSTAGLGGEAGAVVALVAPQLFYATGHLCEFAGLQYTAGFVGSDEFHLWRTGGLLALNTFGAMLLALLALPAVVEYAAAAAQAAAAAASPQKRRRQAAAKLGAAAGGTSSSALRQAVLVAGLARAAVAFCTALSAGIQRRHLYVWALFAPRFAFEALMLGLADLALLAVAALG